MRLYYLSQTHILINKVNGYEVNMRSLWKTFALFWVLSFAYQRKLFHKFWAEVIAIFMNLFIKIAESFNDIVDRIKIPTSKDDPMSETLDKLLALTTAINEKTDKLSEEVNNLTKQINTMTENHNGTIEMYHDLITELYSQENDAIIIEDLIKRLKESTDSLEKSFDDIPINSK